MIERKRPSKQPEPEAYVFSVEDWAIRIEAIRDEGRSYAEKAVGCLVQMGQKLIDARMQLPHGQFEELCEVIPDFGLRTAERLMAIARHPELSKATNWSLLPATTSGLYELSRIPKTALADIMRAGKVNPDMTAKEVRALLPAPEKKVAAAKARGTYEAIVGASVTEDSQPEDATVTSKVYHSHPDDPEFKKPFEYPEDYAERLCRQVRRLDRSQLKKLEAFLKDLQPGPVIEGTRVQQQ
jgi:hypothetical protein